MIDWWGIIAVFIQRLLNRVNHRITPLSRRYIAAKPQITLRRPADYPQLKPQTEVFRWINIRTKGCWIYQRQRGLPRPPSITIFFFVKNAIVSPFICDFSEQFHAKWGRIADSRDICLTSFSFFLRHLENLLLRLTILLDSWLTATIGCQPGF